LQNTSSKDDNRIGCEPPMGVHTYLTGKKMLFITRKISLPGIIGTLIEDNCRIWISSEESQWKCFLRVPLLSRTIPVILNLFTYLENVLFWQRVQRISVCLLGNLL